VLSIVQLGSAALVAHRRCYGVSFATDGCGLVCGACGKHATAHSTWPCLAYADETHFGELIDQLRTELGYWEAYLTASRHVASDDYTLADIAAGLSC
jgi:glutathione S-transferase